MSIMSTVDCLFLNEGLHQGNLKARFEAHLECFNTWQYITAMITRNLHPFRLAVHNLLFFCVNELAVFGCQGRGITEETYLTAPPLFLPGQTVEPGRTPAETAQWEQSRPIKIPPPKKGIAHI